MLSLSTSSPGWPYLYYGSWIGALSLLSFSLRQFFINNNSSAAAAAKTVVEEDSLDEEVQHLHNSAEQEKPPVAHPMFDRFKRNYLIVYLTVVGADWFQGPYMYDLYESYGFKMNQIGTLFIMGFASSMVSGPLVGSAADKFGRKFMCLVFCVLYSIACVLVHFNNYWVLFVGRLLSGVATSILFSSFESWMVKQHNIMQFPTEKLSNTFAVATTGNGIVAIAAGIIASLVAEKFGPTAPFKCSFLLLAVAALIIQYTWSENYGDKDSHMGAGIKDSLKAMRSDPKITLVGLMQSFFESGMYCFVFMWTPALKSNTQFNVLLGWVFAAFMICITIGSSTFEILTKKGTKTEDIAGLTFVVGAVTLLIPAFVRNHVARIAAFFIFEVCCGLYFPSLGVLRSRIVPEAQRSTIMTMFRIPLNLIVAIVLLSLDHLTESMVFLICAGCMSAGFFSRTYLSYISREVNEVGLPVEEDVEDVAKNE